jgi:uncharacterized protein YkwD
MGRGGSIVLAVVALLAFVGGVGSADARTDGARTLSARDALEAEVLDEINELRRSRGLAPVRISVALRRAADAHSTAMVTRGFFAHESIDGSAFWKRVARFYPRRPRGSWAVGENLLWSSPDVNGAGALRTWLDSPPHRKILLTPSWREVGLSAVHAASAPGVYGGREVTVVTADFGVR